ncbi:hypothetical protein KRX57_00085 [Weeksellaceae bacterium TAE3-ERU29]|nr:hypothetical protein [Weeksellaceae bacterium TAE3-ERU29]
MKRNLFLIIALFLFASCQKEQTEEHVLTQEDIISLQEIGANNADKIDFNGTFSGEVNGKDYTIKIDDDSFDLDFNGKEYSGKTYISGDGNSIELEPKLGDLKYKYLAWADEEHLVVLDENGNYTENEILLKRK